MSFDLSLKYKTPISGIEFIKQLQNNIKNVLQLSHIIPVPKVDIDKQNYGKRESSSFNYIEKGRNSYLLFMENYNDEIVEVSLDNSIVKEEYYLYVTMRSIFESKVKILLFFCAIITFAEDNNTLILDDGGLLSTKEMEFTPYELKELIRNKTIYHDWETALNAFNNSVLLNESLNNPSIIIKK
ncbi:MAG: hypothetical protein QM726_06685 [Chitinophagaceae bacterium]